MKRPRFFFSHCASKHLAKYACSVIRPSSTSQTASFISVKSCNPFIQKDASAFLIARDSLMIVHANHPSKAAGEAPGGCRIRMAAKPPTATQKFPPGCSFRRTAETERWWEFLSWRSGRDSNPREISLKLISSQPRYDHFDTAAYKIVFYYATLSPPLQGGKKNFSILI